MKTKISSHFDKIQDEINKEISQAKYSIKVAMAWFTNRNLFNSLVEKAQSGVSVEVILSNASSGGYELSYLELLQLKKEGGEIFNRGAVDGLKGGLMHNKFCIIDFKTVINGSFNWTNNAKRNDENIFIIHDAIQADIFNQHFNFLKKNSTPYLEGNIGEVQVSFTSSKNIVTAGELFQLSWETTKNAEEVKLNGVYEKYKGEVGKRIDHDEYFRVEVFIGSKKVVKTLLVRVVKTPVVKYELKYLHPSSNTYTLLLPKKKLAHQFVALEAQQLRLFWSVENAERVKIGEYISLDKKGSLAINFLNTETKTIIAKGILEETRVSFTVHIVKAPKIEYIQSPVPSNLSFESKIKLQKTELPLIFSKSTPTSSINLLKILDLKAKLVNPIDLRINVESTRLSTSKLYTKLQTLLSKKK